MTERNQTELRAKAPGRREFVVRFDGGESTSDAWMLLWGAVEHRRRVLARLAECFTDHRAPNRIEHTVVEIVSQRVLVITLGYEDVNDHEHLRLDPLLAALLGKADPGREPLAAPATIVSVACHPNPPSRRREAVFVDRGQLWKSPCVA